MKHAQGRSWEARIFRLWLRVLPTRFVGSLEEDIVALFEARLEECGRSHLQRLSLLFQSLIDALWHGLGERGHGRKNSTIPQKSGRTSLGAGMESVLQDIRFAVRSLRKRALFTTIAITALGLGIGGTTAMFSVVDGVLLKRLQYKDPETLVTLWRAWPSWRGQEGLDYTWDAIVFPWVDYLNVRNHASTLGAVAAFYGGNRALTGEGEPENRSVFEASANLFELFGVQPVLGRTFLTEEVAPEGDPARVAILSFEIWQSKFGGSPETIGRSILIDGEPFEVVGVLSAGFRLISEPFDTHPNAGDFDDGQRDIWVPLGASGCLENCGNFLQVVGRLAPGVTVDQARAEVQSLLTVGPNDQIARVVSSKEIITRGFGTPLAILLGAAAVLLLIACTNVSGLLIGEATRRQHEISVRSALGGSRSRILRLLLTESVLLGVLGAAVGLFLASVGTKALLAVAPALPRLDAIRIDARALLFAVSAGVGTGVLFGMMPALSQTKKTQAQTLRVRTSDLRTRSLQTGIVTVQIGLTVLLLVTGGLFVRSFFRVMSVDPGFDAGSITTMSVTVPRNPARSATDRSSVFQEILRVSRGVAGVQDVSATSALPFPGRGSSWTVRIRRGAEQFAMTCWARETDPTYTETLRIPLLSGRYLSDADDGNALAAAMVSESLAKHLWPTESPLGQTLRANGIDRTVVGVVGDVRQESLGLEVQPALYLPLAQSNVRRRAMTLAVRAASSDPLATLSALRDAIWSVDPNIVISEPNTLRGLIRESEADDRFRALLMWTFASIAAVLAAVGIFGVTARAVSARAREMAIRSALGAEAKGLVGLVLTDGLLSAALGLALGLVAALWISRLIGHLLFEIDARDPWTFAGAAVLSVTVCALAAYLPARRVTKIEPMEVLAEE